MKSLFTNLFALIGVCTVVFYLIPPVYHAAFPDSGFADKQIAVFHPSPDQKYKAVHFISSGGGAGSGWCKGVISIVPATIPDNLVEQDKQYQDERYSVFAGACDTFSNHENSPKMQWLSNNILEVTFSINSTALHGHSVVLKKSDASNLFNVRFVAHD
jgi:hypothetical protein